MCGICGDIRFDGAIASLAAIETMTQVQAPRGPDTAGVLGHGPVAFGHRRLKVIDLSEHAQQPMTDAHLGLSVTFNGCIYNHRELRRELEAEGYSFFSDGDTEVVLKAYHAWGTDCVTRFNGMFAFAVLERDSGRVVLARDRLGIKPLYLAETPNGLRFASSLPALLAAGGIDTDIDPVALHHYLTFHAVVPAPMTVLKGVRKLPPATVRVIEPDGRTKDTAYWAPPFNQDADDVAKPFEAWREEVLDALRRAVKRRQIADVPVGVLLSGGLDSSLIVGLLAEGGQEGLKTFSIGFEDASGEEGNEFKYSDIVAERFATDHTKIFADADDVIDTLPRTVQAMSEPMVSHDNVGFYMLSHEVAKHVRVVQSGQGADEVFAGYYWYPPLMDSNDPVGDYARVFFDRDQDEYAHTVDRRFVDGNHSLDFVREHFAQPGADRPVDKALRLDTTVMLVDDPVKRVDNMTMSAGLEARVPFLDHELVELAGRIPAEHKIAGDGKHVLKEAARAVIPEAVIDRPKGYFPVPGLKYLRGPYLDFIRDLLTGDRARDRRLFQEDYVDTLFQDPDAHITPLRGSKLWQAALLEMWFQTHGL